MIETRSLVLLEQNVWEIFKNAEQVTLDLHGDVLEQPMLPEWDCQHRSGSLPAREGAARASLSIEGTISGARSNTVPTPYQNRSFSRGPRE